MKLVYIAGPFRGPTTWDIAQNVRAAEALGLDVALAGYMPVIPHANTALFHGQCNDQFWLDGTLLLLSRCDALITLPTWERSSGAKAEVEFAKAHNIPVCHTLAELKQWYLAPYKPPSDYMDESEPKKHVSIYSPSYKHSGGGC
jgi:hypothetical protein